MAENLRAIVAVLVLAIPTFWYLREPLTAQVITRADYNRRVGMWIALTIVLFVAGNFWLFVLASALVLLTFGRRDSNPLAMYLFLLFVAPPFESLIQGFGSINNFIAIDYLRLLSLVVLLPMAFVLLSRPTTPGLLKMPTDKYVFGYIALLLILQAPLSSTTHLLRSAVSDLIDTLLPYYVFSRGISDARRLREAATSFVAAGSVLAVIGVFESLKGWLLYSSLSNVLGVRWGYGSYMLREGSLRATASAGHSIVLGYLLTVALGLHLMLQSVLGNRRYWVMLALLLGAGIVATMSRGPWVGAAAVVVVASVMGPGAAKRLGTYAVLAFLAAPILLITPVGSKIISVLPFIGTVDASTISYREQLFNVSWDVLMLNPIFGSPHFMSNAALEQLRQGEGIIDMVNSYLGVAMVSGFVGLALFSGAFVSSVVGLWRHLVRHPDKGGDDYRTGLALLATLVGVLLILATASSINAIPVVYWCLVGTCSAYLRFARVEREAWLRSPMRHVGVPAQPL